MNEPVYTPPAAFKEAAQDIFTPSEEPEVVEEPTEPTEPTTAPSAAGGSGDSGTGAAGVQGEGAQPSAPSEPVKAPTAAEIAAEVQKGIDARNQPTPEPTKPKEYTPEELDQMFKVWKPAPDLADRIRDGGDGAVTALNEMRDGLLQQFNTMQDYQRQILRDEILKEVGPAIEMVRTQQVEKENNAFYEANPDLKGSEPLVDVVLKVLTAEGYKAPTVEEARKTLADRTRVLLPKSNGVSANGSTAAGVGQQQQTQPPKRPAALSNGGQAGGGAGSGSSAPSNPIADLWS